MKQRKWTIKIVAIFLLAVLLSSLVPSVATAKTPYKTFTIDGYGNVNETQTSYLPHKTITKFGDESFSGLVICMLLRMGKYTLLILKMQE